MFSLCIENCYRSNYKNIDFNSPEKFDDQLNDKMGIIFIYDKDNEQQKDLFINKIQRDLPIINIIENFTCIFFEKQDKEQFLKYIENQLIVEYIPMIFFIEKKGNKYKSTKVDFKFEDFKNKILKINKESLPKTNKNQNYSETPISFNKNLENNFLEKGFKIDQKKVEEAKKRLPPEKKKDDNDITIINYKFPKTSEIVVRIFSKYDKISGMFDFVVSLGDKIFSLLNQEEFILTQSFPRKIIDYNKNLTFEMAGLYPEIIVSIEPKKNN